MDTYFAMHCLTARNLDDNKMDDALKFWTGYDEKKTPVGEEVSKVDIATGQVDIPLIYKGRCQAELLGQQMLSRLSSEKSKRIKRLTIYCGNQLRCIQTAQIIAQKLETNGIFATIVADNRLNARNYGEIAEQAMDVGALKKFYKAKTKSFGEKLELCSTALKYVVVPHKIGVESKQKFFSRVDEFFAEKKDDLDGALVIGGSDIYAYFQTTKTTMAFKGDSLGRGELAKFDANTIQYIKRNGRVVHKNNELSL